jgi:protein required for attachment to host cells
MKPVRTWILVADGAKARIFLNTGPGKGMEELAGDEFSNALPPSRDIGSDKPGRSFNSTGAVRHAIEPATDLHRDRKRAFLGHVARYLDKAHRRGEFDRLVIVAPPPALGDLRSEMDQKLREVVSGEVAHDLVDHPVASVAKHVEKVLAI